MQNYYFLGGFCLDELIIVKRLLSQNPNVCMQNFDKLSALVGLVEKFGQENQTIQQFIKSSFDFTNKDKTSISVCPDWSSFKGTEIAKISAGSNTKIVTVIRSIEQIVSAYVTKEQPINLSKFFLNNEFIELLKYQYANTLHNYENNKNLIHFVDYDDLIDNPSLELNRLNEFLGIPPFEYNTVEVETKKHNAKSILKYHYYKFCQPRFWKSEDHRDETHPIETMLALGINGQFDEASSLGDLLLSQEPDNHRVAYNQGWYEIRKGNLVNGHKLLARGRYERVFGHHVELPSPVWNGEPNKTVLLVLEGGLGDQIHGAGFVRYITNRNCKVIIACDPKLGCILRQIDGVVAVVSHNGMHEVLHDCWVPAMSVVVSLGLEYKDVDGSAYIPRPKVLRGKKFRIGLKWQGNPQFEHEQHRLFPSQLLFGAVQEFDGIEFVSLQRDEGSEHRPEWVRQVPLNSWIETQYAIASCDLVISSCTSVAHMSAAMGTETWIVIPLLSYYLWAKPGDKTEWYDSVTLFRQEKYGDWTSPFAKLNHQLNVKLGERNADQDRLLGAGGQRKR